MIGTKLICRPLHIRIRSLPASRGVNLDRSLIFRFLPGTLRVAARLELIDTKKGGLFAQPILSPTSPIHQFTPVILPFSSRWTCQHIHRPKSDNTDSKTG